MKNFEYILYHIINWKAAEYFRNRFGSETTFAVNGREDIVNEWRNCICSNHNTMKNCKFI